MASTFTLLQVVQWAQQQTQMIPIIGVSGFTDEPALSICNDVLQEMVVKPYNWKFNSFDIVPFYTDATPQPNATVPPVATPNVPPGATVSPNTQDYPHTEAEVAWVEAAWRIDNTSQNQPQPIDQIDSVRVLRPSSEVGTPAQIANMYPTDVGGIWRLWPVPSNSKQWLIGAACQRKVPIKQGLQETWAPFPDEMAWVFRKGFLAMAYRHADDPRFDRAYADFKNAIQLALGGTDVEGNSEAFSPQSSIFLG